MSPSGGFLPPLFLHLESALGSVAKLSTGSEADLSLKGTGVRYEDMMFAVEFRNSDKLLSERYLCSFISDQKIWVFISLTFICSRNAIIAAITRPVIKKHTVKCWFNNNSEIPHSKNRNVDKIKMSIWLKYERSCTYI